jgi:hypothetical protein
METRHSISYRPVQYLAATQNWKSNLENFDWESKFLHLLFEDYFVNLFSSFFNSHLKDIEDRLSSLEESNKVLKKELDGQLLILNMILEEKIKDNSDFLKKSQVTLELKVTEFYRKFAEVKKDIYQLVKSASDCHERFSAPCIDKLV